MKSRINKIIGFLLVVGSILIMISDVFHSENSKKAIILEYYLSFKEINIDRLTHRLLSIRYIAASYFYSIEHSNFLVEENERLNKEISKLNIIISNTVETKLLLEQSSNSIYKDFDLIPITIMSTPSIYYGAIIIDNSIKIKKGDLIVSYCGIIGKISYVGNQMAIVMFVDNPKFFIPIAIESNVEIIGLYSFSQNNLSEIKNKLFIKEGDRIVTLEQQNKIPSGILIGTIIDNQLSILPKKCINNQNMFIIKMKE